MDSGRIHLSHAANETAYPNVFDDFEWVQQHREALLDSYGESVILVYEQQVIGSGATLEAAIEDAEQHLAPEVKQVTPIIEYLNHRYPVLRLNI